MRTQNVSAVLFILFLGFAVLLASGCGSRGSTYSVLGTSQHFVQNKNAFNNKLDILFVINDEPSMSAFQARLVASMASFMSIFQTKGFDFKIAVATTSAYMADPTLAGYDPANVALADFNDYNGTVHSNMFVLTPADSNLFSDFSINAQPNKNSAGQDGRSFSSLRQALRNPRPINTGFLRSDSFLGVILVDNQDDFSGNDRCTGCNVSGRYDAPTLDPLSVYVDFLNQVTGSSGTSARYNVSAMTQIATPCQGGTNMTRIMDFATQTNGILGDICQSDFGSSMAQISNQIAMLSSQFFLTTTPVVSSIRVSINGTSIPQDATNGWTYNSTANSIVFHGTAIPPQDASIDVTFDPTQVSF